VPTHAASAGRPSWWSWLVAAVALAALVLVVWPAIGHGELAGNGSPAPAAAPVPTATPSPSRATPTRTPAPRPSATPRPPATTPATAPVPVSASGKLAVVPGRVAPVGPGRTLTYRVEIEEGLPLDGPAVAAQVHRILTDPRGWQPIEGVAFARTDGPAAFQLIIASPALTDRLCYPLDTIGELSCRNGDRVILNARRWATAVPWYAGRMADYRAYLVNHEVGHRLGHGHKGCPAPGAPAPVMVQQSKSLYGCKPNPWPAVAY
jgi:hypothetical protein